MSSELERLLRQAREKLPGPGATATRLARAAALGAAPGGRPRRLRATLGLGAALLLVGLGIGVGALVAPSGSAARGPHGVGFLPEQGWSVLQNGGDGTAARPATAVAANVPLSPADDSEGLPYTTLRSLPANGVVLVAGFVESGRGVNERFPRRRLPLDVRDAAPFIEWGAQVRPERPLGQYQLLAAVNGYDVDVNLYFGSERPSRRHLDAAQRQLDRLVVGSAVAGDRTRRSAAATPVTAIGAAPSRVIDRTFACSVAPQAGVRYIEVTAVTGFKDPNRPGSWKWSAGATVQNGQGAFAYSLSGAPYPGVTRWLGIDAERCKASRLRVPLSSRGLVGGAASQFQDSDSYKCTTPPRFLLRVRAVFRTPTTLTPQRRWEKRWITTSTAAVASELELAVRTEGGKQLAYTEIHESGRARLFGARSCTFE